MKFNKYVLTLKLFVPLFIQTLTTAYSANAKKKVNKSRYLLNNLNFCPENK